MLAMQYSIHLPGNYDTALIEQRVRARRSLFDDHAGLVHKSFLYNDHDKLYAPFYVWKNLDEAQQFLLDDLFRGVIETFKRHRVRSWFVLQLAYGNRTLQPSYALREIDAVPAEAKLDSYLKQEKDHQAELLSNPNLYMHLLALDADRWEILRFGLWKDKASAAKPHGDSCIDYEVLHVSEPKP